MEDEAETKPAASSKNSADGPRLLNAFDVINMLGGQELGRIMEVSGGPGSKVSAANSANSAPQFLSPFPAGTILSRITSALTSLGASVTVDDKSYKVKGKVMTGRGEISVVAVVYRMSEEMHLVEVHRGRGDILEYNSLYTRLREGIADIVNKGGKK